MGEGVARGSMGTARRRKPVLSRAICKPFIYQSCYVLAPDFSGNDSTRSRSTSGPTCSASTTHSTPIPSSKSMRTSRTPVRSSCVAPVLCVIFCEVLIFTHLQNALIQAPDVASYNTPLTITLLPALPKQWPSGSIRGAKVRGGMTVNLQWANGKPTSASFMADASVVARPVNVVYAGRTLTSFTTSTGMTRSINSF